MPQNMTLNTDREILVSLHGKMETLVDDIREMKETISSKATHESVSSLERRVNFVERRQRTVERKLWMASGALAVVLAMVKLIPVVLQ